LLANDVEGAVAIEEGLHIAFDVNEVLSTFMADDLPDPIRFLKVFNDLLASAAKMAKAEHPRVAAYGELAPTLWAQGKTDAAIQVEHLTDEVAKACNVDILCGYVSNSFKLEQEGQLYERICAEHSAVRSQ
jgi:hypothetical protein